MKKTLLALAVAALSTNAFAVVDLTAKDSAVSLASEIVVPATGGLDIANNAAGALSVTNKLGLSIVEAKKFYARYELTGATFATDSTAELSAEGVTATNQLSESNYVIFEVENETKTGDAANTAAAAALTFNPGKLNLTAKGAVGLTYTLHETLTNAVTNVGALKTVKGTVANFAPALSASFVTKPASSPIDVATNSTEFEAGVTTDLGGFVVEADNTVYGINADTGELIAIANVADLLGDKNALTVAGNFTAALKDGEKLDLNAVKFGDTSAGDLAADKATFKLAADDVANNTFTYTVDGKTAISSGAYTATLTFDAAEGYAIPAVTGTVANLAKNGASAEVDVAMRPGGFYNNVIRITNKSAIAGDVFITVINDDGEKATVNLGDIAGQDSNAIAAGASTNQISISDIYAAVPNLALPRQGKLRLVVEAQVPAGELSVQSLVVSNDGNTLSRFE